MINDTVITAPSFFPSLITGSPSLITRSPLYSILRKLLLVSLLTSIHCSLPDLQGFACSLLPS